MSIKRFDESCIEGGGVAPHENGEYVKYADHIAIQQRLTISEQRADDMVYALARIQGRAEMFIDDGMHMPTPSIEAIRDIAAKAALKPAEGEGS